MPPTIGSIKQSNTYCSGIPRHPARQIDGAQHQRGDMYKPGSAGGALGHRTVIDVVRAKTHTGQGQVIATQRVPRRPT